MSAASDQGAAARALAEQTRQRVAAAKEAAKAADKAKAKRTK
ncbi:hypothetical protein ACIOYT_00680 [Streptomyces halstedii]